MEQTYTVYDNRDNRMVAYGTWREVEDYAECEGRYTVIKNFSCTFVRF